MPTIPDGIFASAYEMDPKTDDLLFDGTLLRDGMVVLTADGFSRDKRFGDDSGKRQREVARWCEVSHVTLRTTRPHRGSEGTPSEPITFVEFVGTYADGVKVKRSYGVVNAWLVKKDSVPAAA